MADGKVYGEALFALAEECKNTDTVLADVSAADEIFKLNPQYVKLLDTPAVTKDEKLTLIDEAFVSFDENLRNLIKILCERHSVYSFGEVKKTFCELYDASRGIEHVEAVTAVPMTDEQIQKMSEKLAAATGKRIIMKNTVAPEILGGVKLRYAGTQLDGSVKTRLDKFESSLKNTVI